MSDVEGQETPTRVDAVIRIPRPNSRFTVVDLFFGLLIRPWLLMLALGAVHLDVWDRVPALGFWETWISLLALRLVRGVRDPWPAHLWMDREKASS